jgi:hypothetical protein
MKMLNQSYLAAESVTGSDVLPLELDDDTRMTCISLAGGSRSTDDVPDFLHLLITRRDESRTVRFISQPASQAAIHLRDDEVDDMKTLVAHLRERAQVSDAPWIRRVLTRLEAILNVDADGPLSLPPPTLPQIAMDAINGKVRSLVLVDPTRPISPENTADPLNLLAEEVRLLAAYVALERQRSPVPALLAGMAGAAGANMMTMAEIRSLGASPPAPRRRPAAAKTKATPKRRAIKGNKTRRG